MYAFMLTVLNDHNITPVDGTVIGVGVAAFFNLLPQISALLTVIWIALRIWVTIRDEFLKKKDKDGN